MLEVPAKRLVVAALALIEIATAGLLVRTRSVEPQAVAMAAALERFRSLDPSGPGAGVYEWSTQGYVEDDGIRRTLPSTSVRILTGAGRCEHLYAEGMSERIEMRETADGLFASHLPIGGALDPEVRLAAFPLKAGSRWRGATGGLDYAGEALPAQSIEIAGTRFETWPSRIEVRLSGRTSGTMVIQLWWAPELGMTVRETHERSLEGPDGRTSARWTTSLKDVRPRT